MSQTLTVDERIAVARDFVEVVFNQHHPELAGEFMTPDIVWHGNSLGTVSGIENQTAFCSPGFSERCQTSAPKSRT